MVDYRDNYMNYKLFLLTILFIIVSVNSDKLLKDKSDVDSDKTVTDKYYTSQKSNSAADNDSKTKPKLDHTIAARQKERDKDKAEEDCTYTFVVKPPESPKCMGELKREKSEIYENMVKMEARMNARDAYTRYQLKNMRTRILVEQSGVQYMKQNMQMQSDEQVTLREKYDTIEQENLALNDAMLDLRKRLHQLEIGQKKTNKLIETNNKNRYMNNNMSNTKGRGYQRDVKSNRSDSSSTDVTRPAQISRCSPPNEEFGGHCYIFIQERRNWKKAEHHCENLGGSLVAVESAGEQTFVVAFLRRINATKNGYWIWAGGHDHNHDGRWTWAPNDRPISQPTFWYPTHPGKAKRQKWCMFLILLGRREYGHWTRDMCHYTTPSLCEIPM